MTLLLVVLAGAGGAVLRYAVEHALDRGPAHSLWALMTVNVAGSALLGALLALADGGRLSATALLIGGTGFCGGLTTFSGFSMATVRTAQHHRRRAAVLVGVTLVACSLAAAAGGWITGVR